MTRRTAQSKEELNGPGGGAVDAASGRGRGRKRGWASAGRRSPLLMLARASPRARLVRVRAGGWLPLLQPLRARPAAQPCYPRRRPQDRRHYLPRTPCDPRAAPSPRFASRVPRPRPRSPGSGPAITAFARTIGAPWCPAAPLPPPRRLCIKRPPPVIYRSLKPRRTACAENLSKITFGSSRTRVSLRVPNLPLSSHDSDNDHDARAPR